MKLIDVSKAFASDEQCLAYLEASRWPHGVRCTVCGAKEVSKITRKVSGKTDNKRAQIYQCLEPSCKSQFSATNGTIFHDSHLPLSKWFMAIALLVDAKKSMSALQLSRHLDCNYRTAWYLAHRIREAMVDSEGPKLTGVVEVDETYIGGRQRGHKGKHKNKDVVIGVRERGGDLRLVHTADAHSGTLYDVIEKHISKDAQAIMTDENPAYNGIADANTRHETVNHSAEEWVRGDVHTNNVENVWSLLKRSIIGAYHKVSMKHLDAYLGELEHRFNNRSNEFLFRDTLLKLVNSERLTFQQLTKAA